MIRGDLNGHVGASSEGYKGVCMVGQVSELETLKV